MKEFISKVFKSDFNGDSGYIVCSKRHGILIFVLQATKAGEEGNEKEKLGQSNIEGKKD